MSASLGLLGKCNFEQHNYIKAYEFLEKKKLLAPHYFRSKDWMHLGIAYLYAGNKKKAKEINDSLHLYAPDEKWLTFEILNYEGDAKGALPILKDEIKAQNEYFSKLIARNVGHIVDSFYAKQLQQFDKDIAAKHNFLILSIISAILAIVVVSLLYYIHAHRMHRRMSESIMLAQQLKNEVTKAAATIQSQEDDISRLSKSNFDANNRARQEIQQLISGRFSTLDELCRNYYEIRNNKIEKKRMYEKVISLINSIREDSEIRSQMETLVNKSINNLMKDFKRDFPELKPYETDLFLFNVLGFSTQAISVFQNIKISSVYTRKSNLKRMIGESAVADKERYLAYLQAQT